LPRVGGALSARFRQYRGAAASVSNGDRDSNLSGCLAKARIEPAAALRSD